MILLETILRALVLAGAVGVFLLARHGEAINARRQLGFFWWIIAATSVGRLLFAGPGAVWPWPGYPIHAAVVCLLGVVIHTTQQERARLDEVGPPLSTTAFRLINVTYLLGAAAFGLSQFLIEDLAPATLAAMATLGSVSAPVLLFFGAGGVQLTRGRTAPWAVGGLLVLAGATVASFFGPAGA